MSRDFSMMGGNKDVQSFTFGQSARGGSNSNSRGQITIRYYTGWSDAYMHFRQADGSALAQARACVTECRSSLRSLVRHASTLPVAAVTCAWLHSLASAADCIAAHVPKCDGA